MFEFNSTADATEGPISMPSSVLVKAVEADSTLILFVTAPGPELPIILEFTCVAAVVLFIKIPVNAEGAGAVPVLLISNPPTWLPVTIPPLLKWFIPLMIEVYVDEVVAVETTIDPFATFD
ncbi:MAG: hypothetical protein ABI594_15110, partial [Ginsengibacter sp.]